MYSLDASAFYIALVLLHEYFTQKAKLLPYTTELSLQSWSISFSQQSRRNDGTLFKTASLQVRFFAINDVIATVVAVKFGKAFCFGQDLTLGNSCAKFCLIPINTDRGSYAVSAGLALFVASYPKHCSVRMHALINMFITYKHIHNK